MLKWGRLENLARQARDERAYVRVPELENWLPLDFGANWIHCPRRVATRLIRE